jgi:hypothetical protein
LEDIGSLFFQVADAHADRPSDDVLERMADKGHLQPHRAGRSAGLGLGSGRGAVLLRSEAFRAEKFGRGRGSFFLDLGEEPGLGRGSRPLSLDIIMGETAGLDDKGAQLGNAAAARVIEVDKREAGPGHRILQERDRRCRRQAMLAAEMEKSADQAVASISVIITAARPVAVVGKKIEHEVEQLHRFCDFRFGHSFDLSRSG